MMDSLEAERTPGSQSESNGFKLGKEAKLASITHAKALQFRTLLSHSVLLTRVVAMLGSWGERIKIS